MIWMMLVFCLFLLSFYFSGIEVGLISLDRLKIKEMVTRKNKVATYVNSLLEDLESTLAVSLLGINLCNIAISIIATNKFLPFFTNRFGPVWDDFIMTGALLTPMIVIFAEILPKEIFRQRPMKAVFRSYSILRITNIIFYIPAKLIRFFIHLFVSEKQNNSFFTNKEELEQLIKISNKSGVLTPGEKEMMEGIFDLSTTQVKEIMTQRVNVVAVEANSTTKELISLAEEHGHSRFPVYGESIDDIKGFVFVLDVIYDENANMEESKVTDYIRDIKFVPETKKVDKLFREMKMSQEQIRMVVDEYGQVSGLISLEDIIEEIVGEINDEFDEVEEVGVLSKDGGLIIEASIPVEELNEQYEFAIPEGEEYDTLAGFLEDYTGVIPNVNQVIKWEDHIFTIISKQKNSIGKVKIMVNKKDEKKEEDNVSG